MSYTPHDPSRDHEPIWSPDDPRECVLCDSEDWAEAYLKLHQENRELLTALEELRGAVHAEDLARHTLEWHNSLGNQHATRWRIIKAKKGAEAAIAKARGEISEHRPSPVETASEASP